MERECQTSIHVRRIAEGDIESVAWVVQRFTPLLLAQAETRLTAALRQVYDPSDLVQDVWSRVLVHLKDLAPHDGSYSLAVLKYVSAALVRRVINLIERRVAGLPAEYLTDSFRDAAIPDTASGVVTRVIRDERRGLVHAAIDALEPKDREILVLCGIEQRPAKEVAVMLEISPNLVSQRYRRAVERLRDQLPKSVFDDLSSESP